MAVVEFIAIHFFVSTAEDVCINILLCRFSHANCKKCIVGLLNRVGKAYESNRRHSTFIMDLMKLDTPNLLLVRSTREDDSKVDQLFIEMVCTFIQKNGLHEIVLSQVPTIMVINIILQFYFMAA